MKNKNADGMQACAGCAVLILVFLFWPVLFDGCGSEPPTAQDRAREMKTDAYLASTNFVRARLKAPATADFPYSGDASITEGPIGTFTVIAYVDSENSFGATLRTNWACTVSYSGGALPWHLVSLDIAE